MKSKLLDGFVMASIMWCPILSMATPALQPIAKSSPQAVQAHTYAVIHEVRCSDRTYLLRISYVPARVEFVHPLARDAVDIGHTGFAETLLKQNQHGGFGVSCPQSGINLSFVGFEFAKEKTAVPIRYRLTINDNGEIVGYSGLLRTNVREVADVLGSGP